MIDPKIIDEFSAKVSAAIPPGVGKLKEEVEQNIRTTVEKLFQKLNLVSREEFDIQSAVLLRTREKLEALEKQLADLEQKYTATTDKQPDKE